MYVVFVEAEYVATAHGLKEAVFLGVCMRGLSCFRGVMRDVGHTMVYEDNFGSPFHLVGQQPGDYPQLEARHLSSFGTTLFGSVSAPGNSAWFP